MGSAIEAKKKIVEEITEKLNSSVSTNHCRLSRLKCFGDNRTPQTTPGSRRRV